MPACRTFPVWSGFPRRQVVRMVAHDQQRATRLDRRSRRPQRTLPRKVRRMQELRSHQIEGGHGLPLFQVTLFPVDAAGNFTGSLRVHTLAVQGRLFVAERPFQRDGGHIDGGDGPTLLGQPDGVGPSPQPRSRALPGFSPAPSRTSCGLGFPLQNFALLRYLSSHASAALRCGASPAACRRRPLCGGGPHPVQSCLKPAPAGHPKATPAPPATRA
ncbi:hypothetical protein AHiyo4_47370 [Arthrobacter sp. Hiyo4]|nr:hypothetical protein AHiyo4_47370 [Arthrobacter sp. Hiyo4]